MALQLSRSATPLLGEKLAAFAGISETSMILSKLWGADFLDAEEDFCESDEGDLDAAFLDDMDGPDAEYNAINPPIARPEKLKRQSVRSLVDVGNMFLFLSLSLSLSISLSLSLSLSPPPPSLSPSLSPLSSHTLSLALSLSLSLILSLSDTLTR